ncbi:MAG: aldehyde dehydrogenase family protein, partial [Acidimicrobiales bacterium]|nr:aldehyde dehydrogenase family protein [Acidimicrobiales bacterium]
GPVLGVMRADDLDHAIALQNSTDYGLTGGIHTLEDDDVERWLEGVEVGNAYVNRTITGAIVQRQPFGGWKHSAIGPGAKAGGPNYVRNLRRWVDTAPRDEAWLDRARGSDERWWLDHYSTQHDPSALYCESNILRYRPLPRAVIWVASDADPIEVQRCTLAARRCCEQVLVLSEDEFVTNQVGPYDRVRVVGSASGLVISAALAAGAQLIDTPVTGDGRIELGYYLREQAVSRTLHRFGNVA